jgi:class 3 adenylate cyclase
MTAPLERENARSRQRPVACDRAALGSSALESSATLATTRQEREVRKTVTVVFRDVIGSTAPGGQTDPEALRALLARYFERMTAIVESYGGTWRSSSATR